VRAIGNRRVARLVAILVEEGRGGARKAPAPSGVLVGTRRMGEKNLEKGRGGSAERGGRAE